MTKRDRKDSSMKDHGQSSKRKREDMRTPKLEMKQVAEERSFGKQGRTKFPFSSREIARPGGRTRVVGKKLQRCQCRIQVELMELESQLVKMEGEMRDSYESLFAAKIEVNQSEVKLEQLITTRNMLKDNLLKMRATEAFLMHELGIP
ncbi:hypothetical protein DITRI_Ditri06bG0133300 [Diplodiscus trichospermus]